MNPIGRGKKQPDCGDFIFLFQTNWSAACLINNKNIDYL
jgi:hypothetical protein